jgi:hypothetical protein
MYACTDRLCHPRASPPTTEKKPETHKQTKNSTNLNTQKHTHKKHTNQHAKAEGQRDRATLHYRETSHTQGSSRSSERWTFI